MGRDQLMNEELKELRDIKKLLILLALKNEVSVNEVVKEEIWPRR